jgi:hypothetical protein
VTLKLRTRGVIPRLVVVSALLVLAAIGVVTARSLAAPVGAPAPGVCSETCAPTATGSINGLVQSHRELRYYEVEP